MTNTFVVGEVECVWENGTPFNSMTSLKAICLCLCVCMFEFGPYSGARMCMCLRLYG